MDKNIKMNNNDVKIMILEGAELLKNNLEGRYLYKQYKGVFAYSLLLDKLNDLKLNVSKNITTRDIITLQFSYGYNPKDESIKSMNKEQVRDYLYKNGFSIDFYKKDKETKEQVIDKTIKYKFWFRTPSKSRVGDVMFINEKLFDKIKIWQMMGLELPTVGEAKIVEMGAYESLTASHIEGKIEINPNNILVVDDIDSFFTTKCALVKTNKSGECFVEHGNYTVKNTLFDGMALVEDSLINGDNGMMLLRQHFFKACGFRSYIKKFMMDWCEANNKDYETFTVKDRYNNDIKVKDILMITTENAMKWEKFKDIGASFDYWKQKVNEDNNIFGICKVDHESKYGDKQRMSYQMVNSLPINFDDTFQIAKDSIDYVNNMKNDNNLYLDYLKRNISEVNPNEMLIGLCSHNEEFLKSEFFRNYKKKDLSKYVETLRNGKLLTNADNLTLCGNPYTLLLHAVGKVPVNNNVLDESYIDETLPLANVGEEQYISVYTKRFEDGEELCAFRNPQNSPNNIGYHKNFRHELMEKYFNFSNNIIAINMIQTEEQDLKNGEDEDSDFNYVSNNKILAECAKKVFRNFPCIVNKIGQSNKPYENKIENYSLVDNGLAKSKYDIGLSSNLAQLALSWYWDEPNQELADIVCIMSVLAQVAIDNSKRQYSVDVSKEINRIRKLKCMEHTTLNSKGKKIKAKPKFWKYVSDKVKEDSLVECKCPMNFLQDILTKNIIVGSKTKDTIDNVKFINIIEGKADDRQIKSVENTIKEYDDMVKEHNDKVADGTVEHDEDKWQEEQIIMQNEVVSKINSLKIKQKTMQILIAKALSENGMNKKYRRKMLNGLYKSHKELFLSCFAKEI